MTNPSLPGVHVRYEKAGLILDALPVPWNADAVIVEANVKLPRSGAPAKQDFALKLGDGPRAPAELLASDRSPLRVLFRVPTPSATARAEVFWREHSLGRVEVPIVALDAFVEALKIELPTVQAGIGPHTIPCRSLVIRQAHTLCATAILASPTPLAPVADLDLHVRFDGPTEPTAMVPVHLTSDQRRARQTLVSVQLPRPRRVGECAVAWQLGSRRLAVQHLSAVSKKAFLQSIRITATRFLLEREDGTIEAIRSFALCDGQPNFDGITRVTPCFFVCSSVHGLAGLASLRVRTSLLEETASAIALDQEALITDGPTPILAGAIDAGDLPRVKHFTLECAARTLGTLPLTPAPKADFNAEGGFGALDDFLWSAAADEQLKERLGKLLDGA